MHTRILIIILVLSLSSSAFQFLIPRLSQHHPQGSSRNSIFVSQQEKPIAKRLAATAIDLEEILESSIANSNSNNNNNNSNSRMQEEKKSTSSLSDFSDTTNKADLVEALKKGETLNATENVFTVDQDNNPTEFGHPRNQMRLHKMWHRATYIVIRHDYNNNTEEGQTNNEEEDDEFLLVQRRTKIKDYCPGKLDPAPGGVVGFGESYLLNATREMMEEMNIDLSEGSGNEIQELVTFPYQDDNVKVWGGMFEVTYRKPLKDIKMQPEEVSEVLRLSIKDIRKMASKDPDDWMMDGLHAIRLYLQYKRDNALQRKILSGYSNGNLQNYKLRPKPEVILFDCDDCLYFDGWQLADKLTAKIEEWCVSEKNLAPGKAYQLYKDHGTALKGLLAEGLIKDSDEEIDAYLRDVHDVPVFEQLSKDKELREMILSIDPTIPKYIFTASVRHHAERCLKALGIEDLFVDIIDVKSCNLATKHSTEAFEAALKIAKATDPEKVLFLDDSVKNLRVARSMGIRSFLVGKVGRDCGQPIASEDAENELDRIHDLPKVVPEIFEV